MQEYPFPVVMPYEYLISVGECQWGDLYIHDYRSQQIYRMKRRKLIGPETDSTEPDELGESLEEKGGEIIAIESKTLDYINERQYHGLVGTKRMLNSSSKRKRLSLRRL